IRDPKLMSTAMLELKPGLCTVQNPTLLGFSGLEMLIRGTTRPKLTSAVIARLPTPAMSTGTPPRFGRHAGRAAGTNPQTAVTRRLLLFAGPQPESVVRRDWFIADPEAHAQIPIAGRTGTRRRQHRWLICTRRPRGSI